MGTDDSNAPNPDATSLRSPAFETQYAERSIAADRYFTEVWKILGYFETIQHQAAALDRLTCIVKHGRDCHREGSHPFMSPATASLSYSIEMLAEMFVSRLVDNFLVYLVEVYGEVAQLDPRILVSESESSKVSFGQALDVGFDAASIIAITAEKAARSFIHQPVEGLNKLFSRHLGVDVFGPRDQRDALAEAIASRNVIVHSRGVINDEYMRLVPAPPSGAKPGVHRLAIERFDQYVGSVAKVTTRVVEAIEKAALGKFTFKKLAHGSTYDPTVFDKTEYRRRTADDIEMADKIADALARRRGESA